jgi:diketogulonate reductase-like aldo/keto reductase
VGTYLILGKELTNKVIDDALSAGYRLFDSAHVYNNEKDLGNAFKELLPRHNLTRNDIFITTKICKLSFDRVSDRKVNFISQFLPRSTKLKPTTKNWFVIL